MRKYKGGGKMTMVPMWKKCPKCHNSYNWNPDVGQFKCPYCGGVGMPLSNLMDLILKKKKKTTSE